MIKINCLKWGTLYGPEYVNRVYGGLLKHCQAPFHFVCYTDDAEGISSKIEVRDIEELRPYDTNMVFTYEKLMLIDKNEYDKNFWIDLDLEHLLNAFSCSNVIHFSPSPACFRPSSI